MIRVTRGSSPRYRRDDIESFLLISRKTTCSRNLAVTLVEMQPGGLQHRHSHEPEQMYYILQGSGIMTVDGSEEEVAAGDCVFIPSGSTHGLVNTGAVLLRYLSAASPSFSAEECDELWPLPPLGET
ncbi:MAG: cupin domain-containing protein [Spirochaetes bacterium]|nr:cupin domain-containing protein [Spirochaetota bacterium]